MLKRLFLFIFVITSLCVVSTSVLANTASPTSTTDVDIYLDDENNKDLEEVTIEDETMPMASLPEEWAIGNLLCIVGIGVCEIIILFKKQKDIDDQMYSNLRVKGKDLDQYENQNTIIKCIGFGLFVISDFIFFTTENMYFDIVPTDRYTPLMVGLLIVGILLLLYSLSLHKKINKALMEA